jgi:hypothetical protein
LKKQQKYELTFDLPSNSYGIKHDCHHVVPLTTNVFLQEGAKTLIT